MIGLEDDFEVFVVVGIIFDFFFLFVVFGDTFRWFRIFLDQFSICLYLLVRCCVFHLLFSLDFIF